MPVRCAPQFVEDLQALDPAVVVRRIEDLNSVPRTDLGRVLAKNDIRALTRFLRGGFTDEDGADAFIAAFAFIAGGMASNGGDAAKLRAEMAESGFADEPNSAIERIMEVVELLPSDVWEEMTLPERIAKVMPVVESFSLSAALRDPETTDEPETDGGTLLARMVPVGIIRITTSGDEATLFQVLSPQLDTLIAGLEHLRTEIHALETLRRGRRDADHSGDGTV